MQVPIVLDRASRVPLHQQIYDQWRERILTGRFRGGQKVPSTRELAEALAVSRTTVTAAYEQLLSEGYFESARGAGTFVSRELPDDLLHPRPPAQRAHPRAAVRLSAYARRLDTFTRPPVDEAATINLSKFGPDPDHFPVHLWRRLIGRHLRSPDAPAYGYPGASAGHEALRAEIAAYIARSRAVRCTPDQVIVVNGSQQALDLCARLLLDAGDEVAVEHPGYPGARELFTAHGARLRAARITDEGMVIAGLTKRTRLVYVTPSRQFPTGVPMSLARRLELLEWARPLGAVILEDDYDSVYRYRGAPLPALQSLAAGTAVIYIGTFSNVMFPGLRIGYLVVPEELVTPFSRAKWLSDRQTPILEQAALADFIRDGHLERHIRRMRSIYRRRRDVMIDALDRHFGAGADVRGDAAGMHMLVRFRGRPDGLGGARRTVHLVDTRGYYMRETPAHEYLLAFSAIGERTIREGIKRLAARP